MVRSAAKNHAFVGIVTDPEDYAAVIEELDANGGATTLGLRKRLAATAFAHTATYDGMIASWRSEEHTSELQSLMRISYAVFCLNKKTAHTPTRAAHRATSEHQVNRH